jgi:DNA polymerase IV
VTVEPPMGRTILHIDMDAYYAAIEVLLNPSLRGKPVIVGGDGSRGVVASCSYEARAFGVRSAMSSVTAKRMCPHAVFVSGNHSLYGEYSTRMHEIFARYTPDIEPIALDEAFLDVSAARRLSGSGSTIARTIRDVVFDELKLYCSVGVAPSKLIAKLASKLAKPPIGGGPPPRLPGAKRPSEGVLTVAPGNEQAFIRPLSVRSLWGVGPKTFEQLQRFGVQTIGDLADVPLDALCGVLGAASGNHLHELAHARDDRPVVPERGAKSIGHEETFSFDSFSLEHLATELLRMSDAVSARARASNARGRTIQLKIKFSDFTLVTRSKTVPQHVETMHEIHGIATALLREPSLVARIEQSGVRLVGVSVSNFTETTEQMSLFAEVANASPSPTDDDRVLAGTIDAIRAKFGTVAVGPAVLARKGRLRVKQAGDTQWGPSRDPETTAE